MNESPPSLTLTIIKRELLTGLRSWKSFLVLLAMLVVLYGTAYFAMGMASSSYVFMAGVMRSLFTMQVVAVGCIVYAIVPAMAAVSINGERQEENYELLLTTLISPRRIILGKYIAVLIRALLVATAVLPFTGLVYFYAGVDVDSFFGALAVLVPAALCNAAVGIWCSNFIVQPAPSLFLTFGIIAVLAGLVPASEATYYYLSYSLQVKSFLNLGSLIIQHRLETYGFCQLVFCMLFMLNALFPLRGIANLPLLHHSSVAAARKETPFATARAPRVSLLEIPDGANPMGYKDLCGASLRRPLSAMIAFVMTVSVYVVLFLWFLSGAAELLPVLGVLERVFLLVLIPPMMAVLMVKEREDISFDMLRLTMLTPVSLVAGKLLVLLRLLKPVLLAVLLCKSITVGILVTRIDIFQYPPDTFVSVLDLLLLLPHLIFGILASMVGSAFPKKLIPAICGATGFSLIASAFLFIAQVNSEPSPTLSDFDFAMTFLTTNLLLTGIFSVVLAGIAMAIISEKWRYEGGVTHREDALHRPSQPPSLPK